MKQRTLLIIALVCAVIIAVAMGSFFSSALASWENGNNPVASTFTPTLLPTPTDTPAPIPTATPTDPPTPTPTPPPLVNGSSAYLLDATTGRGLLDVNSHLRVAMWSTTKIMTALLAIKNLNPNQVVTIEQAELDEMPPGMSNADLQPNDQMIVKDLLYGLLLPSGSDAAYVLAHEVAGNTASFIALMNTTATQLGLTDTHYTNPAGADDAGHYSSAADLVKLARVAMSYPLFAQIVDTSTYSIPANISHHKYSWENVNESFLQSFPGANGIKTGSNADETDWCIVFSAFRQGHLLIGAEMQTTSNQQMVTDADNILEKGFQAL